MSTATIQKPETGIEQRKNLAPWQLALIQAEGKFLAISGKKEETKIELGFAAMLLEGNEKLKGCSQESIINAVINVARTGITLNPILKLAHLVPRGGKCILDFDYKGLVKVLKDNGCIKHIDAIIVYEDEEFEESNSPVVPPSHKVIYMKTEAEQKKRTYKGVYCRVLLLDNTVVYTKFMPYWEVLKTEKVSQAAKSEYSPWNTWREEMVKKTKIKRDFKTLISGSPNDKVIAALEIEESNTGVIFSPPALTQEDKEQERIELMISDCKTLDDLELLQGSYPEIDVKLFDAQKEKINAAKK